MRTVKLESTGCTRALLLTAASFAAAIGGACGDSSDSDSKESNTCGADKAVPVQECEPNRSQSEAPLMETDEELKRSRVGREKGLLPACFMMYAPEYSCEYGVSANETRCHAAAWGQAEPERDFVVTWQDQGCDSYTGDVYLEDSSSEKSKRLLVGHFVPLEPGRFRVESENDFELGLPWAAPLGGSSVVLVLDQGGSCFVNLHAKPDAEGVSAEVSLCDDQW